ncbi:hypothetical protein AX774_g5772 [Zancudomyces culisetae]|uniref:Anaphase-promoting complex subunit 2 n=1 Tax=Zancudomyces culisetae TaxID=1213189 RepID=A0A1R1PIP6_ZANCU|nr:hypothetical protein AX774_g5772 [Zancudomyces culisetae]|eukprot:OMH80783.1 hypothetical protein AX774_g5772 [Zancudomyces culisetae]
MMFGGEIPSFGRDNIWVSDGTDITSLVMHWKKSTTATQESVGGGYQNSIRSRAVERKIVTLLVELISNKRVFIAEFERKLSEKLIKANNSIELRELEQVVYKLQKEIGSKELVANCLVMLNDIKLSFEFCEECNLDSNRDSGGSRVVVISENHWPIKSANKSGGANVQFNTPGFVADSASFYKEMYSKVNDTHRNSAGSSSRRLVFCGPNHGFVELHIELKCGFSRTFECKPLAATVLLSINQQSSDDSNGFNGWVKHSDLIKCMDCHATEVNNAIEYWLDNNILLEYTNQVNDFYYKPKESISDTVSQLPASQLPVSVPVAATLNIASHYNTHSININNNNNNNNNNTDYETTNNTGLDIGLSQYDNYIIGMLTNLGPLPLDRIADMLEMFIDTDISFKDSDSKALLQSHLEALVQNRTLKFDSHQRCYSLC